MEKSTIVIDAQGAIFGRLSAFAAKKALEGNHVVIVNAEKTIITGDKNSIVAKYHDLRQKGQKHSMRGPSISKVSYKILKRGIRGMLPNHRWGIGKEALERVICHNGVPAEFKDHKMIKIETQSKVKYITLAELSKIM